MSIGFDRPLVFAAACIIIPLSVLGAKRFSNFFTLSLPLGPPGGIPFKPPFNAEALIRLLRFLEYGGILLLAAAAAGPVVKTAETLWLNQGADILFVLDTSPSMAGIDMDGKSRFDAARSLIRAFAENRPSDSVGLVAVGNDAALMLPPTPDRAALFSRLESLRVAELGDGTALGMGIAVAALHLENSAAPRRAVALVTDGENNAGAIHPETAAAMLPGLGISLWVIGLGSGGEVPIDYVDPLTRMRRTGTFESRFNPENLAALCRAGEGTCLLAPSADALAAAFSRLSEGEMIIGRSGLFTRRKPCHIPFIAGALVILAAVRWIRSLFLGAWV
ncbi:MAG: VWA domain-containing protein [Treponema sp.]|jgi:Ca-activated chloride channel family protein|nr:VWA domain-containing protein [Treponema sp.]